MYHVYSQIHIRGVNFWCFKATMFIDIATDFVLTKLVNMFYDISQLFCFKMKKKDILNNDCKDTLSFLGPFFLQILIEVGMILEFTKAKLCYVMLCYVMLC